jgi:phosphate transport system substrate-binding protein
MTYHLVVGVSVLIASLASGSVFAEQTVDANIPVYQKTAALSGNLSSVGSNTLVKLMTLWAEEFKRIYPQVNIQIQAVGSSSAPPALTAAISDLGPMSRKMTSQERQAFAKKYIYKPTAVPVAIDALAVYVNNDNPIKGMSIAQVDAVMSSTRNCGYSTDIMTWGQLGLGGAWADRSIQLFGRNSVSGTYEIFRNRALCKGDFKRTVSEQADSASVVQAIASSKIGIGYSAVGSKISGVRIVPLAKKPAAKFVDATPGNVLAGTYPLARYMYIYVNKQPDKPLALLQHEFLKMVLSQTGQRLVIKGGEIAMPAAVVNKAQAIIR